MVQVKLSKDRGATHIMAFEGNSKIFWFEGNFSEHEADRRCRQLPGVPKFSGVIG